MGSYKAPGQALGILPYCFLPVYYLFRLLFPLFSLLIFFVPFLLHTVFLDHDIAIYIFHWRYVRLVVVGVGEQEIVSIHVSVMKRKAKDKYQT